MAIRIHLDVIVRDMLTGWAINDDLPETPLKVEVLVGVRSLGTVVADEERPGLDAPGGDRPRIGFKFRLPGTLLNGKVRAFTVRVRGENGEYRSLDQELRTTRLPFAAPARKPWVESMENRPAPIPFDESELEDVLELVADGEIDMAVGLARRQFRANQELFAVDTGIVEAVSMHTGVKSFEQLMADRTYDWLTSGNHALWQSRLMKKEAMHAVARRNLVAVPRQIAQFSDPAELLTLELPPSYVAKPDGLASAKGVFPVSDGVNMFSGRQVTPELIVDAWRGLAERTDRIDCFIVEEFVVDRWVSEVHPIPLDFKIYVFGGTAGFLEVFDRNHPGPSRTPYSIGWRPLPQPFETRHDLGPRLRRPDNLGALIDAAESVGQDIGTFCRVDLFNSHRGPVLGEITILPANGKNRTPYANLLLQQAYIVFEDQQLWSVPA